MSGWPTYSPAAAQALADIAQTHIVRPLPAFDLKGDLIHPSRYMAELRGATVLAGFSTTVYHIGEKNASGRDVVRVTVCLDIEHLRVLIPAPQFSPKKRSAIHLTDPISRANQKRRAFCRQYSNMGGRRGKRQGSPLERATGVVKVKRESSVEHVRGVSLVSGDSDGEEVVRVLLPFGAQRDDDEHLWSLVSPDIEHEDWISPTALLRLADFMSFESPPSEPWYALAKVPSATTWVTRSVNQWMLYSFGMPLRIFAVGPIVDMAFYTGLYNKQARSRITVCLMRAQDRAALASLLDRANWTSGPKGAAPVPRFTAIAMHNREELFKNIYDATTTYTVRERMATVHPCALNLGDVVLVEAVMVRTVWGMQWSAGFHADAIARLVVRPVKTGGSAPAEDQNLYVEPVAFTRSL
ncbi:hypothetical protein K466DRAFT_597766 [Polyporus arcularius HHB13444]|uniref:Uncharacterized protein n=1 Tax=Polyporus arcularius HHB13444 TaxID=1314778 RepID=A0A5C3PJH3_9APHY|nr:hypothetical protein K466DRAFT_597766 [Polyporus arcularius HHB13444]